ncbi:MAG: ion transporter [Verrucomicrobiota bacterium]
MRQTEKIGPWDFVILALSIYVLAAMCLEVLVPLNSNVKGVIEDADFVVCIIFMADFFRRFFQAKSKMGYLKWGWIDLASSIPTVDWLRWGRFVRVFKILRILRGVRSAKEIVRFVFASRAKGTAASAVLVAFVLMLTCTMAILLLENSPDSNIKTPGDAAWWALATITTVGYGDKFPVTHEGRMVGAILMICGVGLFGTLSGLVASWFLESDEEPRLQVDEAILKDIQSRIVELQAKVDELSVRPPPAISALLRNAPQHPEDGNRPGMP